MPAIGCALRPYVLIVVGCLSLIAAMLIVPLAPARRAFLWVVETVEPPWP